MTVRREIVRKGVLREAYRACDETEAFFQSCASRFTNDASRTSAAVFQAAFAFSILPMA
jgi:hypothetical protein